MNCYTSSRPVIIFLICFSLFTIRVHAQQAKEKRIAILNQAQQGAFPLVAQGKAVPIYYDSNEPQVVRIAAKALKEDITLVTGCMPLLDSSDTWSGYELIIGTIGKSKPIDQLISSGKLEVSGVKDQWETFNISVIDQPLSRMKQALVIAGSDPRGTAFGVFELSKMMGVSPFYWWADVVPEHKKEIYVAGGSMTSQPPSVKYRGIFINDEDWGLRPWAAKTFEPETGDIGPKTYARVFELLLRLKANLIWPAMHPGTKAFFHYPGNVKAAADYAIIVGSSHAEPMLRNNVDEWDEKTMGHFNYLTNKSTVYQYWEDRVRQSSGINAVYTLGMRGIHDSGMEGVKDAKEAIPLLERIFSDQRGLLARYINKDTSAIPQAFTAYKEVLDIYDAGLKLPDDVTLVWPDDNYGYIQRLSNEKEKVRPGGSGVYYHASYWGRPHDYLWLGSVHPSLMREEMVKAYENGSSRLWVLNVGDIKPLEYSIKEFLDMAFDVTPFKSSSYTKQHLLQWAADLFGKQKAQEIQSVLWEYYQLAFERKPEFMGWSQTEPTTKTTYTDFNPFFYGDEVQRRIDRYDTLEHQVKALRPQIASKDQAAFYQLVYYPVVGASLINKKFLYRDKSYLYAKQNRLSALDYAQMSGAAYDSIVRETDYFNTQLAGGKWNHMMSMKPRELPVFLAPSLPEISIDKSAGWSLAPEGFISQDSSISKGVNSLQLPPFDPLNQQKYFIDIFLTDRRPVEWTASASDPRIRLSEVSGNLSPEAGKNQMRLWVTIDWNKARGKGQFTGEIIFNGQDKQLPVGITGAGAFFPVPDPAGYKGFIENNGYISIQATHYSRQVNQRSGQWRPLAGIGYTGEAMEAGSVALEDAIHLKDTEWIRKNTSFLEYDFFNFSPANAEVTVFTLPTLPLNKDYSMRYAVSVDDGPLQVVDFRTFGRSEEWKQNVLSNRAKQKIRVSSLAKGNHTLKIFSVDPGIILDEIHIDLGGLKRSYSIIPETKSISLE